MPPRPPLALLVVACASALLPSPSTCAAQRPLRACFAGMVNAESFAEEGTAVAFRLLDPERNPIVGSKAELVVRGSVRSSAVSDASGDAWLTIDRRSFRQGGILRIDALGSCKGCSVGVDFTSGFNAHEMDVACAHIVDLRKALLLRSDDGRLGVLYAAAAEAGIATAVLEQVVKAMAAFEQVTGHAAPKVGVYLEDDACVQASGTRFDQVWGLDVDGQSLARGEVATLIHESAEELLREVVDGDRTGDPRWFYDGFANLIALRGLERCDPGEAARFRESHEGGLRKDPRAVVDLSAWRSMSRALKGKEFLAAIPSYAKSLAIATCLDDAGPTDIAALLATLASTPPSTADELIAAVARWGGTTPPDLAQRLRSLDSASAATCLAVER